MASQHVIEDEVYEAYVPDPPITPRTLKETGLSLGFISDLVLKLLFTRGSMLGLQLSRQSALPFKILEEALIFLKEEKCVEISGGDLIGAVSYRFALTDYGRQRSRDAMETSAYVGAAPVPLERYVDQCNRQMVTGIPISRNGLRNAFGHMVITDELFDTVGPAIVSGKAVFIYGPPGTGKTTIARAIGDYMNECGGAIYVPYAILAEDGIISIFDPIVHVPTDDSANDQGPDQLSLVRRLLNEDSLDTRWVKIRRPVIITGGELTLDMLDLRYSSSANMYTAPLHIKANGGVFLIDDFGRQLCTPKELLNRWIFPLESRADFMALASGKKFMVPFEQLTIFSTNMDPRDLVDDAFLRRMRHKMGIAAPSREVYDQIFNLYAKKLGLNKSVECIEYLYEKYYNKGRVNRPSDCRDLLEIVVSICRFRREEPHLNLELMQEATRQFFAEF